jgi:hypothetical protein
MRYFLQKTDFFKFFLFMLMPFLKNILYLYLALIYN